MSKKQSIFILGILLILSLFLGCQLSETDDDLKLTNEGVTSGTTNRSCAYIDIHWYSPFIEEYGPVKYTDFYSCIYKEKLSGGTVVSSSCVTVIFPNGNAYYQYPNCISAPGTWRLRVDMYASCFIYNYGMIYECTGHHRYTYYGQAVTIH